MRRFAIFTALGALLLVGLAAAQYRFQNTGRINRVLMLTGQQLDLADAEGSYPLAVFIDKLDRKDASRSYSRKLSKGLVYTIEVIGEGGKGITDADLYVRDSKGWVSVRDEELSNIARVVVAPKADDMYTFTASAADFGSAQDGFFSLVISAAAK